ncbi:MAG TPA: GntR family transcriptional regulator [Pseudonocardia sp.]
MHEIGDSIHAGHLRPGQELSLREVAEQRRVRLRTLTQLVTGLERDGLLVRRGDVAIVAPLNLDELTSAFKLRRIVETSLLTRAGALIPDHELDRLAAAIPTEVGQDTDATFGAAMRQFNLGLLRPAATNVDLASSGTSITPPAATTVSASRHCGRTASRAVDCCVTSTGVTSSSH